MAPDNEPVTKADLAVIHGKLDALRELFENELRHIQEDVTENTRWREAFMAEDGPWRTMDDRVNALENLAKSIKWAAAALSPIAVWAAIEFIKAAVMALRGGP